MWGKWFGRASDIRRIGPLSKSATHVVGLPPVTLGEGPLDACCISGKPLDTGRLVSIGQFCLSEVGEIIIQK